MYTQRESTNRFSFRHVFFRKGNLNRYSTRSRGRLFIMSTSVMGKTIRDLQYRGLFLTQINQKTINSNYQQLEHGVIKQQNLDRLIMDKQNVLYTGKYNHRVDTSTKLDFWTHDKTSQFNCLKTW